MGLTSSSVGINAVDSAFNIIKQNDNDKVIALAGNPNVGKSTVFNALTGMKQHTGNWPGKTVAGAQGYCSTENHSFVMSTYRVLILFSHIQPKRRSQEILYASAILTLLSLSATQPALNAISILFCRQWRSLQM